MFTLIWHFFVSSWQKSQPHFPAGELNPSLPVWLLQKVKLNSFNFSNLFSMVVLITMDVIYIWPEAGLCSPIGQWPLTSSNVFKNNFGTLALYSGISCHCSTILNSQLILFKLSGIIVLCQRKNSRILQIFNLENGWHSWGQRSCAFITLPAHSYEWNW